MYLFIFLCMLFAHVVDDYYLQGILAKMKQKSWWREQTSDEKYRHDYVAALIAHGVSWSFMTLLPCNIYFLINSPDKIYTMGIIFAWTAFLHCVIDHLKCNEYAISLCQDQLYHLCQILANFVAFYILCL